MNSESIASGIHLVTGSSGMVGGATTRALANAGVVDVVGIGSRHVDLTDRQQTLTFIGDLKPECVVVAAARVGGIEANSQLPVEFLADNVRIAVNVLEACHLANVDRVLYLGSSCIYPRLAPQPITEDALLTGPLEATNDAYAIAKIAGLLHVQGYRRQFGHRWISAMPTNLYGPGDNYALDSSHVLPAMIRKFHESAATGEPVRLFGTGSPRREFLHVDDLAAALVTLLDKYDDPTPINVGTGDDISIRDLAGIVADVTGCTSEVIWDSSKPDGTPRKLLDVSKIHSLGWKSQIPLRAGIEQTYEDFVNTLLSDNVTIRGVDDRRRTPDSLSGDRAAEYVDLQETAQPSHV